MISMMVNFHRVEKIKVKTGLPDYNYVYIVLIGENKEEQEITVFFDTSEHRLQFLEELKSGNIERKEGL
jgi:hypothetical protein